MSTEPALAPEVPPLNDPAYLAPYTDVDEGKYEKYESPESLHGVSGLFRQP